MMQRKQLTETLRLTMAINIPILTSFVDKGVTAAEKAFGGLSKSTMIAGAAIAGATVAVGAFAYKSIQKASDFNEAISKNAVVFGAISKEPLYTSTFEFVSGSPNPVLFETIKMPC